MFTEIGRFIKSRWLSRRGRSAEGDLFSALDIGRHPYGQYSVATIQANELNEDAWQVETCPTLAGTFVGVYDGHGGPEASSYVKENLFPQLLRYVVETGCMSSDALMKAFDTTEKGFESLVAEAWPSIPQLASVGSCCLVGVVLKNMLFVANLGDSRAVLGTIGKTARNMAHVQLTLEHNAGVEAVQKELQSLHPEDSNIVICRQGIWRVKGIIQISRSIGDFYLKKQHFNREPLFPRFRLPSLPRPVLSAEPTVLIHELQPHDKFVIFASDGLWEHLSNQEAVEIVSMHPYKGAATRLVKAATRKAAEKREVRYSDMKKIGVGGMPSIDSYLIPFHQ
ncbi:hypothetical protein KP509_03G046400 [Ceratopteris richardii]|uniref:protein-serine/threonine phosphatase n=1 Tax=Ceratopteris richardii TaxID=49495 RepID=A0A8T2UZM2_CERRI|nr:hypothetical protein KP509_03G046400 [Ceratopteris richardii]KAH7441627.1 hypothetical protein KP509_03G046400 [Ceratopteris richardii]